MRGNEGPAKNLRLKRRKNVQQDTKTQCFLCWFFNSVAKEIFKLGGFSLPFAEITDKKNTKLELSTMGDTQFHVIIYHTFFFFQVSFQ